MICHHYLTERAHLFCVSEDFTQPAAKFIPFGAYDLSFFLRNHAYQAGTEDEKATIWSRLSCGLSCFSSKLFSFGNLAFGCFLRLILLISRHVEFYILGATRLSLTQIRPSFECVRNSREYIDVDLQNPLVGHFKAYTNQLDRLYHAW